MTSFTAEWLSLREPYDAAARNGAVLGAVAEAFRAASSIRIVDLACGTGATLRALGAHLPMHQHWTLVDNDLGLLSRVAAPESSSNITIVRRPTDLVRDLEFALDGARDLVTTSALLDLVSLEWIERLAVEAAARRLPVYAALTYNGRTLIEPSDAGDDAIVAAVNAHQRSDKGFGPALGPAAATCSAESFQAVGYQVLQGQSDWLIGPAERAIQEVIFAGWAKVALQSRAIAPDLVAMWLARRRGHLEERRSRLRVGHIDVFARPMGTR